MKQSRRHFKYHLLAVILLFSQFNFASDELGRLFTSVEQRHALNKLRNGDASSKQEHDNHRSQSEPTQEQKTLIDKITINGYIQKSSGDEAVWISGRQIKLNPSNNSKIKIIKPNTGSGHIRYSVPGSGNIIELKPGQSYYTNSKKVLENYQANPLTQDISVIGRSKPSKK